jgi:hypothetical protein
MKALHWLGGLLAEYARAARTVVTLVPWLLLPALLTEGAQHIAEIQLGMFASRDTFVVMTNDPTRWAFGYAKIAGLFISILLVARYVATGSVRRTLLPSGWALITIVGLLALTTALDMAFQSPSARAIAPDMVLQSINIALQVPLTALMLSALFEDRWADLKAAGWGVAAAMIASALLPALAFVPMQMLHGLNHEWAMAQPTWVIVALMTFDTLLVGAMALALGAGAAVGWRRFVGGAQ